MTSHIPKLEMQGISKKVHFYLSVHRFDAAEKLLLATLDTYGSVANIHNLLGVTYHRQSKFPDALTQFDRAMRANPNYVEAGLNLAATLCDLSYYEDAREIFADLSSRLKNEQKVPSLILGRLANRHAENGQLYEHNDLTNEAISEYKKALHLFPNMSDVKLALAKLYLKQGQVDSARRELEDLLEHNAPDCEARHLLGTLFYKQGRSDRAKDEWLYAARENPDDLASQTYRNIAKTIES